MKCPKCGEYLTKKGSPNGGRLYVAEEIGCATECFDSNINMWKCPFCKTTAYISKKKI